MTSSPVTTPEFTFRGPWFSSAEAAAYVGSKSVKGFYEWRRRKHIVPRSNGSVAKADLDRVLRARKPKRVMSPVSLANLRLRHSRRSHAETVNGSAGPGHFNSIESEQR